MKGVSIVVCCYNSAVRLPHTLACLASQKTDSTLSWEVIIVDNASTDNSAQVALDCWASFNSSVKLSVVKEDLPGLNHARLKGVMHALYDVIVFCDDDNWLSKQYIQLAFQSMDRDQEIGMVGGCAEPVFESERPRWFGYFKSFYAIGEQSKSSIGNINGFQYLYGAGVVVRKRVMDDLSASQFQNVTTDRIGNSLTSGGDIELCVAAQLLGYKVLYNEHLRLKHFISINKLNFFYALKLVTGIGYSSDLLFPYRKLFGDEHSFPFPSFASLWEAMRECLVSIVVLFIPLKRYGNFYERLRNLSFFYGRLKFHLFNRHYFLHTSQFLRSK